MNTTTVGAEKKEEIIVTSEDTQNDAKIHSENVTSASTDENVSSRDPEKHEELDSAKMRKDLQDAKW